MNNDFLRSVLVWSPPLVEQDRLLRRIERAAAHLFSVTQTADELLKRLDERQQALITAAVTGQIDVTTARGVA